MAEENDNVLGIQATINGSDIEKGANDFIAKINGMERAADHATNAMADGFQFLDKQIQQLSSSLEANRQKLEGIFSQIQSFKPANNGISQEAYTKLQDEYAKAIGMQQELEGKVSRATEEINIQRKAYEQLTEKIRENGKEAIASSQPQGGASTDNIRNIKEQMKALGVEIKNNEKLYGEQAQKLSEYENKIERYQNAMAKGQTRIGIGGAKSELVEPALKKTMQEYDALRQKQSAVTNEIDQQKQKQQELNAQLEQANPKIVRFRTELMNIKQQMMEMKRNGQANTAEFQQLSQKAAELQKIMTATNAQTKLMASPKLGFQATREGITMLTGSLTGVTAIMSMFNSKSEDVAKMQKRLQEVMAITMAVQQLMSINYATSALRTYALGKANLFLTTTTNSLRTAFVGMGLSASAARIAVAVLYTTLTLGFSLLIGGIVTAISAWTEASQKHKKALEEEKKIQSDYAKGIADNSAKQIVSFKKLQQQYEELGKSIDKKNKFVKENKSAFDSLGVSVTNATQADNLFIKNSEAFINSVRERAKALAAASVAQDLYKEAISIENDESQKYHMFKSVSKAEYDKAKSEGKPTKTETTKGIGASVAGQSTSTEYVTYYVAGELTKYAKERQERAKTLKAKADKFISEYISSDTKADKILSDANIDKKGKDKQDNEEASNANRMKSLNEKEKSMILKQAKEKEETERKAYYELEQNRIDLENDKSKKTRMQMELNHEKEMDAFNKEWDDMIQKNKDNAKAAFNIQEEKNAVGNKNYVKKTFDDSNIGLTDEQEQEMSQKLESITSKHRKDSNDLLKSEAESMRSYLKEYGTFQQQKLAIAEEYAEKIKNAGTEGERKILERQRDSALLNVDAKAAQQNIDWQGVFGDLGMILKDQTQPTIDNLKELVKSDKFKNSDITDQQKIYEILSNLEKQSGSLGKDMFKDVARDLQLYRNSLNAYNSAQQREIDATNKLITAKENLKKAEENGGDVEAAKEAVSEAQGEFDKASESVKFFGDKAAENAETLKTSSERARGALENLSNGLNKLKSGSLSQAFDGVKDLGKTIGGKVGDAIANIDPTGIISGVLSILDILKDGFSGIFVSLQDTLFGAVEGILDDVLSGDIVMKPLNNALSHIGNIANTLTFGGFNSWTGGNGKEVSKVTDRLTDSNERLRQAVDNLKDEMKEYGGLKAIDTASQAESNQKTINEQTMKILQEQMSYWGSHHSNASNWGEFESYGNSGFLDALKMIVNKTNYKNLNETLAEYAKKNGKELKEVWSLQDIYTLTPEEMDYIRTNNIEMWKAMTEAGEYDKSQYWNDYADLAGQLDQITDSLKENLNQISFDNMKSSFIDSLLDMDKSAADMADDFTTYLTKSIMNAKINDLLDKDLQDFYDTWADYSKSDNRLNDAERDALKKMWEELTQKGVEIRDEVASFTGYDTTSSSQDSTSKGFETMSQDTGEELNGRFTALQESGEKVRAQSEMQTGFLQLISIDASEISRQMITQNQYISEIVDIQNESVGHLSDISKNTKQLYQMNERLGKIEENTKRL